MPTSEHVTLAIDGMSCGHCVASVRKALDAVPGVANATVTIGSASFTAETGSAEQVTSDVVQSITEAGYPATPSNARVHAVTSASASCCSTPAVHQLGRS